MLFPHVLLMLSASPRMSGFIFQVSINVLLILSLARRSRPFGKVLGEINLQFTLN